MTSSTTLRALALVSVVVNVAFDATYDRLGLGLEKIRVLSDRYETLFTPAPFAFAIWGLIYASLAGYAIVSLLPSQREQRVHDRIAPALIAMNVLAMAWIAVFTSDHPASSLVLIGAMVVCGIALVRRAAAGAPMVRHPHVLLAPFSLLLGWLSVASIANVSQAAVAHGMFPKPLFTACTMLTVALLLGLAMAVRFADGVFLGVIAWAASALAVAQRSVSDAFANYAIVVAVIAGLASVATLTLLVVRRVGPGLPSRLPDETPAGV